MSVSALFCHIAKPLTLTGLVSFLFLPMAFGQDKVALALSKVRLQKNPGYNERLIPKSIFWNHVASGIDADNWDDIHHLIHAPEFKLINASSSTDLQSLIDESILKILSTPTGNQICGNGLSKIETLIKDLGVSTQAAQAILKMCQPRIGGFSPMLLHPNHIRKRQIYFIDIGNTPLWMTGFSTTRNNMLIIVNDQTRTDVEVLRIIAHEMAMIYDAVDNLVNESGENNRKGNGLHSMEEFTDFDFFDSKNREELSCAFIDPIVSVAFAMERAFRFEDKIIKELGLLDISPRKASWKKCEGAAAAWIPRAEPWNVRWAMKIKTWKSPQAAQCRIEEDSRKRLPQLARYVRLIQNTHAKSKTSNRTLSLCEVIVSPRVDSHGGILAYEGGPRPRVGGWDSAETNLKSASENLEQYFLGKKISDSDISKITPYLKRQTLTHDPNDISSYIIEGYIDPHGPLVGGRP